MRSKMMLGICLVAFMMASAATLRAENTYTLKDCFQAALKHSDVLAGQEELVVQAEEHYHQALGAVLPQVNVAASYFAQQQGTPTDPANQSLVKLGATEALFRGFREYAALRQNSKYITYQQESKQWAALQLYSDVAQSFYTVLSLERDSSLVDAEIGVYQQRIAELNAFIRIGRSRTTEVLTVQSAEALLKTQKVEIQGQLEVAREVLAFLTGMPETIALNDVDSAPATLDTLEAYSALLENRPDVAAARKKTEAIAENITIAKGARLPSVDVGANYYLTRPVPYQNNTNNWDAQISLTMPIFTGGIISSQIAEAESQYRQSQADLSQVRRLGLEEIRNDYHNLKADIAQAGALEEALVYTHKNYLAELRDYKNGLVTNLDVLSALTTDQDTKRSLDKMQFSIQTDYQHLEAAAAKIKF